MRRGLAPSRNDARALVESGRVTVGGAPAAKVDRQVAPDEAVHVSGPAARYVGRGGEKLHGALEALAIDPSDGRWLDAGASTGGFTDCLLQHGAREVVAVDVGRGQLHERLRRDPRVDSREQTDIRSVTLDSIGRPVDGAVADLAFIGLGLVMPALVALAAPGAPVLVLVKPQFEAGRAEAAKGRGVIRDPDVWHRVLTEVIATAQHEGATIMGGMVSPVRGAEGNVEFFLHLATPGPSGGGPSSAARSEPLVQRLITDASAPDADVRSGEDG